MGRRDATRARASTRDEGEMVRAMRAQALATNANPSVKAIVDTLAELAEQEFGLANVKFQEVMAKMDECFDFEPTAYARRRDVARDEERGGDEQWIVQDVLFRENARIERGRGAAVVLRALRGRGERAERGLAREHSSLHGKRIRRIDVRGRGVESERR